MICPKCGARLAQGSTICPICGTKIRPSKVKVQDNYEEQPDQGYDSDSDDDYEENLNDDYVDGEVGHKGVFLGKAFLIRQVFFIFQFGELGGDVGKYEERRSSFSSCLRRLWAILVVEARTRLRST